MKNLIFLTCIIFATFFTNAKITLAQVVQTSTKLEASTIYEKSVSSVVNITCVDSKGNVSVGSGVILRSDGIIATNHHVIFDAVAAKVSLPNGDIYDDVAILDTDERKDIAIIKIKAVSLPVLESANSDLVKIGSTVYTIGSPKGLTGSLSAGLISGLRSASELSPDLVGFRIIQFTAPTSHGSSGGALLDENGKLIGLVFASKVGGQNLNVAIPVNYVIPLSSNAKGDGKSLKKISTLPMQEVSKPSNANELEGTYTGVWSSDRYPVSGTIVLTITKISEQYKVKAVFTGSEYFNEDELITTFTKIGDDIWKMNYKGKKTKITGTGLFKAGKFVGDYKFRKFIWVDLGKWVLEK
jgi:S1-C subfamily serine protease